MLTENKTLISALKSLELTEWVISFWIRVKNKDDKNIEETNRKIKRNLFPLCIFSIIY